MLRSSNISSIKLTLETSMDLLMLVMLKMCWRASSHLAPVSNVLSDSSFSIFAIKTLPTKQTRCMRRFVPQLELEVHYL